MEIQYFGGNCLKIANKKVSIVFDDNLKALGKKPVTQKGDVAVFSGPHTDLDQEVRLMIDYPGEYEVADVSISGVQARAHMDEEGKRTAVMYRFDMDDIRVAVLGHVHPDLTNAQLEQLGVIDVLVVPVGGNGYTLDGIGALKLVKKIEPKIIIPTHYAETGLNYEVPQQELKDALQSLAIEPVETVEKLKLKVAEVGETQRVLVLKSI
jgi:L-ascorbate metabolism protein UlaG (beta-lactamase superfamily)